MSMPNSINSKMTMRLRLGWALAASLALLTAACGNLINVTGPPANLYNLTPKSTFVGDLPEADWQLVIEEPLAAGGLDTDRIALRPTPTELKYFAESRWTSRAPRMVQGLLIESFENTGKIIAVGRQAIGLRSDYNLKTELREFQAEYFGDNPVPNIRVRINAKIVKQPRQVIIASRSFEEVFEAHDGSMNAIIEAFDEALGAVLKDVVQWTLQQPGRAES